MADVVEVVEAVEAVEAEEEEEEEEEEEVLPCQHQEVPRTSCSTTSSSGPKNDGSPPSHL